MSMNIYCNDGSVIYNGQMFLDAVKNALGIDTDDFINGIDMLLTDYGYYAPDGNGTHPIGEMFYGIVEDYEIKSDGVYGDDYYIMLESLTDLSNELDTIKSSLLDRSRKGNTRADIAKKVDAVASNLRNWV